MRLALVLLLAAGCGGGDGTSDGDADSDTDTDSGSDGDTDTDSDGDTDADTDTDTGSDTGPDCPSDEDALDPLGEDTNCDDAEGIADESIYVWDLGGDDGFEGTPDFPVQTLDRALEIAEGDATKRFVFLSEGTFDGASLGALLALGVEVVGALRPDAAWSRDPGDDAATRTTITAPPGGAIALGGDSSALRYLTLVGAASDEDPDAIALVLRSMTAFELEQAALVAGDARAGAAGQPGDDAEAPTGPGGVGTANGGDGLANGSAGVGGQSDLCGSGGLPRAGAGHDAFTATCFGERGEPGQGGAPGTANCSGAAGADGDDGTAGRGGEGATAGFTFHRAVGAIVALDGAGSGERGAMGDGGGGGGASLGPGEGGACTSGGAGGGGGGCGGFGGGGGSNGGHSIALVVDGDLPSFDAVVLTAGAGGAGGEGGAGGLGSAGGSGGAAATCGAGDGGDGGMGGEGGGGGGGEGGSSIALLQVVAGLSPELPAGATATVGAGGAAGIGGAIGGADGSVGAAYEVLAIAPDECVSVRHEVYETFSASADAWELSGNSSWVDATDEVRLTPALVNQTGSAILDTSIHADRFRATFWAFLGSGTGGEGMTFAWFDDADADVLGAGGFGLGAMGEGGYGVALDSLGADAGLSLVDTETMSRLQTTAGTGFRQGKWIPVSVTFDDGDLDASAADGAQALVATIDGYAAYDAYFGFTGATGATTDVHAVDEITLRYEELVCP